MEKTGIVINTKDGMAKVAVKRTSGCGGGCKTCGGCDTPTIVVDLPNNVGAKVGDEVELRADDRRVLRFTFLIYIIPLIFMFIAISLAMNFFATSQTAGAEPLSFLIGILVFILVFIGIKWFDKKIGSQDSTMMFIYRIIR